MPDVRAKSLQGNAIRSMKGLQNLVSLTELDLRCNLLASYPELRSLKGRQLKPSLCACTL